MTEKRSALDVVNEALAPLSLVVGAVLVVLNGAPLMAIIIVCLIVVGGASHWLTLRKLGGEAREAGNGLLLVVGITLLALGAF
jgi:hypothetical protein